MSFTLTEDHLALLKHAYVQWDDAESGAPAIDPKRPYGNSDVETDIAEILTGSSPLLEEDARWDREGDLVSVSLPDGRVLTGSDLKKLHRETADALQIVLCTGGFVPGTYRKTVPYSGRSWELVTS